MSYLRTWIGLGSNSTSSRIYSYNDSMNRNIGRSPFEVVYGMHPRGVYELRDMQGIDRRSAQGEDFVVAIRDIHQQVRETLQNNVEKYKERADLKIRDLQFKVGDLMLAHLKKERIPKGKYTKMMMKNIGPCRVVHKFGPNAYEIELSLGVAISPIFNVFDLYPYKSFLVVGSDAGTTTTKNDDWVKELPPSQPMKLDCILDTKEVKKTRRKTYKEYLIKWQDLLEEFATWMTENNIKQHGVSIEDLISRGT